MAKKRNAKGKKKSGPKNRPARSMSMQTRPAPRGASDHNMLVKGVCEVSNPFCDEAKGSRWPDNSHTKSIGWGYQNVLKPIIVGAGGSTAYLFGASLFNTVYEPVSISGSSVNFTAAGVPVVSAPFPVGRMRLTSWGLRINSSLSKMTATGTAHIRLYSPETYAALTTTEVSTNMCDASFDIPISRLIDKDIFIIPMPLGLDARLFSPTDSPSAVISNQSTGGWQIVQVGCTGAPASSTPLNVYMYYHWELVPNDNDSNNFFGRAPPASSPIVREANASTLARVGNFLEGTAARVDALFQSKALKYLAGAAGFYAGGPQAGMAAMQITDRGQRLALTVD